jgi:hypothetical protein
MPETWRLRPILSVYGHWTAVDTLKHDACQQEIAAFCRWPGNWGKEDGVKKPAGGGLLGKAGKG